MAFPYDPFDDLIGDLERTLPPPPSDAVIDASWVGGIPPFEYMQFAIGPILYGTKEGQERAARDPRVQAFWAWMARQPPCRHSPEKSSATADTTDLPSESL